MKTAIDKEVLEWCCECHLNRRHLSLAEVAAEARYIVRATGQYLVEDETEWREEVDGGFEPAEDFVVGGKHPLVLQAYNACHTAKE